ncbi:2-keto-3-deoxy-L-rhamnonate aldolase [Handroanthus impetiginosus]|uniref:2-keto-3-deoxy-L-rhamnonate aldolase n=1 Tax=Handroanthus impetiginosus TaxID=429701 RepID=A0A2G9GCD3_9LAMI|nr:2-keto-3-deoxy-L-rhamnonate aldolase [Handroanthus impetiginosus]
MASLSHPSSLSSSSLSTLRKSLHTNTNPYSTIFSFSFPVPQPQTLTLSPNLKAVKPRPPHSSTNSTPVAAVSRTQSLKSRLKNGETLYGIFLLTFSPTIAEIAGLAGYDFAVVDMEHGHGGIFAALPCLHALAATNTAAILRLPESFHDGWS